MAELAIPFLARTPWARRILTPLVFTLALVIFLFATFPYDALSQRITAEAHAAGYDITIGALGHAGLVGIVATDVRLKPVTADAAAGPLEIKLDKLTLKPEILGLLLRRTAVAFSVDGYGGSGHGVARFSNDPKTPGLSALQLVIDTLDLKQLPPSMLSGIDVIGQFGVQGDVTSLQVLEASGGTMQFGLKGGAILKGSVMGMPLPKTMLGDLSGGFTLDKGVAHLEKVQLRGGDIEAEVEGTIRMKPLLALSQADLKVHLKPKDSWIDANPLIKGSIGFLGPKTGDGYWLTVTGPLSHLTPRPGR